MRIESFRLHSEHTYIQPTCIHFRVGMMAINFHTGRDASNNYDFGYLCEHVHSPWQLASQTGTKCEKVSIISYTPVSKPECECHFSGKDTLRFGETTCFFQLPCPYRSIMTYGRAEIAMTINR